MRAMVLGGGGRLLPRELPRPVPGSGQLLVRVKAVGVDPAARQGPWRWRLPAIGGVGGIGAGGEARVPGIEVTGEAAAVGPEVADFEPGDAVCALLDPGAGGGYAEYAVAAASSSVLLPAGWSFEEGAALLLGGLTALQGLRDVAGLQAGERIAVGDAGGAVGHLVVQAAAAMGARVTAVASPAAQELVLRLGAERAVDFTREDFTALAAVRLLEPAEPAAAGTRRGQGRSGAGSRRRGGEGRRRAEAADSPYVSYAVIFDAGGDLRFSACEPALVAGGVFVTTRRGADVVVAHLRGALARLIDRAEARRAAAVVPRPGAADLDHLAQLAADGRLRPVIERAFAFDDAAAAHVAARQAAATGEARGALVLRLDP